MELRRKGKIDDQVFAETRLRRGAYGQRYDNGQRHDGVASQTLEFPAGELTKGPETLWDAPGMQRIKIPYGGMTPEQIEVLAELAEEYSDAILHVTTRQDIQLHFVHIDDTPDLMRRLAAVGITTREACGNSVRNVTACPLAGVCHTEAFDVTAYAAALLRFLLGHPDSQDFGRKFKIAFSGCAGEACGLVMMHDFGAIARTTVVDGVEQRGFELYVGGGLGTVPHQAKLLDEFLPDEELLPAVQAIARVFARLGEKAQPQPRAHQVPGRQARHRRVPPPGGRGARDAAARRPLDLVPALGGGLHRVARARGRPRARRRTRRLPDGLPRVAADQRLPPAPARLRRRDGHPAARRPHLGADAQAGRHRPQVRRRRRAHHGRAEHRPALGARGRPAGALRRRWPRSTSPRPAPARSSTSPPAPAPTPASSASPPRAAWPASCAPAWPRSSSSSTRPSAACTSRSAAASTRAASTTSPTSASSASAATSTASPCRTSRSCSAASGATTPAPTAWPSARCRRSASPRWSTRITDRSCASARARRPSRTGSPASARRSSGR